MATLSKQELVEALARLGDLAAERGVKIELALFGGGVMVLVMGARIHSGRRCRRVGAEGAVARAGVGKVSSPRAGLARQLAE